MNKKMIEFIDKLSEQELLKLRSIIDEKIQNNLIDKIPYSSLTIPLLSYDIRYWSQLSNFKKNTIKLFRGMGPKRLEKLELEMKKRGISFLPEL